MEMVVLDQCLDAYEDHGMVWKWFKPQLPERPASPKGGRPWVDDELCLRGFVWVLKTSARRKDMPKDFGVSGVSCWRRLADWSNDGFFQAAWATALWPMAPTTTTICVSDSPNAAIILLAPHRENLKKPPRHDGRHMRGYKNDMSWNGPKVGCECSVGLSSATNNTVSIAPSSSRSPASLLSEKGM
jgi:hypothetical protein